MSGSPMIRVDDVRKSFYVPHYRSDSLKYSFINALSRKSRQKDMFEAIKGVSFEINEGEFFGILGRNGSGKSTLLKMLAGVYATDSGAIDVRGKLVPFIELGVGFRPDLTGRENVYLNGALLGFSKKEMDQKYDEIVGFAELEHFMGQKLKNYSSGMKVRLAFAVATHADADILLLDEVLAVGDASFQKKCYNHFKELKKANKTVVFVTHSMGLAREYCDRGVLIEEGVVQAAGNIEKVADAYTQLFNPTVNGKGKPKKINRWGDETIVISSFKISKSKQTIKLRFRLKANELTSDFVKFGFRIHDAQGRLLLGANNLNVSGGKKLDFSRHSIIELEYVVGNVLGDGTYLLSATINKGGGSVICDNWTEMARIDNVRENVHYPLVAQGSLSIRNIS